MSENVKQGPVNTGSATGVLGNVGDNYKMKDMPFYMPKENKNMFDNMKKRSDECSFGNWPNPFNAFWNVQK